MSVLDVVLKTRTLNIESSSLLSEMVKKLLDFFYWTIFVKCYIPLIRFSLSCSCSRHHFLSSDDMARGFLRFSLISFITL